MTEAHHNRTLTPVRWRLHRQPVVEVWGWADMRMRGKALEQLLLKRGGQGHMGDIDQQQLLLARVVAALVHLHLLERGHGHAQGLGNQRWQCLWGMVQRQLELGQAQHGGGSVFRIKRAL